MPTTMIAEDCEAVLWRRYRAASEDDDLAAARNALTVHYLPLLNACARRLAGRLPAHADTGDLRSAGVFGLFDAIDRFDPDRGVAFTTYARHKIHSAMLDHLRSLDDVSRLARHRLRRIERTHEKFLQRHGRPATDDELGEALGLSTGQVARVVREGRTAVPLRMSQAPSDDGETQDRPWSIAQALPDPRACPPDEAAERASLRRFVLEGFSRAEQLILVLYYYEGLSMREIGLTLDLSESRVSQMHSSIIARLRSRFADDPKRFGELLTQRH